MISALKNALKPRIYMVLGHFLLILSNRNNLTKNADSGTRTHQKARFYVHSRHLLCILLCMVLIFRSAYITIKRVNIQEIKDRSVIGQGMKMVYLLKFLENRSVCVPKIPSTLAPIAFCAALTAASVDFPYLPSTVIEPAIFLL